MKLKRKKKQLKIKLQRSNTDKVERTWYLNVTIAAIKINVDGLKMVAFSMHSEVWKRRLWDLFFKYRFKNLILEWHYYKRRCCNHWPTLETEMLSFTLKLRICSLKRKPAEFDAFVTVYLQQRFGFAFLVSGGWMFMTLMKQTFHLAPSSGQANLVFLKYLSMMSMQMQLGIAPGIGLFSLISCEQQLFWAENLSSYPEANMELFWKWFSRMFHCLGQKATPLLGRCLWAPLFSPGALQLCQTVWTCTQLLELDSGPGPSWTIPKPWFSSDEASLLSIWMNVLLLCWKGKWIFFYSVLPEAFVPNLTGIWNVMEIPGSRWGKAALEHDAAAAATTTLHSSAHVQWCVYTKHRCWN